MSCPEFTYAPRGRQGIGVIQPQSGLDYPLVSPSEDIRYLIADMYFEYDDPGLYGGVSGVAQHPLKIKWLYGVGCEESTPINGMPTPTHTADIVLVDANNNVVFDSTTIEDTDYHRFLVKDWGSDYKIYEWLSATAVCRLVVYKNWAPDESNPTHYPIHLAPVNATIDERAIYKMPKRVKSLRVLQSIMRRTPVIFQAGYNMRLTTAAQEIVGLRYQTAVTYDAVPGAGFGQYSDCTDEKPKFIYTINGVGANKYGDFFVTGDQCLFARTQTIPSGQNAVQEKLTAGKGGLNINTDCPACCSCEDYVETALYMNKLRNKYAQVGSRSHKVKLLHENNIDRWLEQRTCRLNKPLRLSLSPLSCPYMEVIMQFCNHCPECVEDVVLSVTLAGGATGEIVPGYTVINAPGTPNESFRINGGWPTFSARIGFVDKGSSVFVRFLLKFTPRGFAYPITGTLTGTIKGQPIKPCDPNYGSNEIAQSVDTRALYCNEDGCTDTFVETSTIAVINSSKEIVDDGNGGISEIKYTVNAETTDGGAVVYQWQYSENGSEWFNLTDADMAVAGAKQKTLQLTFVYLGQYPNRTHRVFLSASNATSRTFAPQ